MSGIPHDHYEPKSNAEKWLHSRLPIVGLLYDTLMIPTPKNLNWMWIWGIVLVFCLVMQIVTGIILVMHYTPHVDLAFASVEHIMRNVNGDGRSAISTKTGRLCSLSRFICTFSVVFTTAPTRRHAKSHGLSVC